MCRWGWYRLLWGLPVLLTVIVLGTVLHDGYYGEFLGFLPLYLFNAGAANGCSPCCPR